MPVARAAADHHAVRVIGQHGADRIGRIGARREVEPVHPALQPRQEHRSRVGARRIDIQREHHPHPGLVRLNEQVREVLRRRIQPGGSGQHDRVDPEQFQVAEPVA